jgi:hypothetical protein
MGRMSLLQDQNVGVKMSLEDKLESKTAIDAIKLIFLPWGATQDSMNHREFIRDKRDENTYLFAKNKPLIAMGALFDFYKTFVAVAYAVAMYTYLT